jgi:hypothetical protein
MDSESGNLEDQIVNGSIIVKSVIWGVGILSVSHAQSKRYRCIYQIYITLCVQSFMNANQNPFERYFVVAQKVLDICIHFKPEKFHQFDPNPTHIMLIFFLCQRGWNKGMKSWSFRNWGDTFYLHRWRQHRCLPTVSYPWILFTAISAL